MGIEWMEQGRCLGQDRSLFFRRTDEDLEPALRHCRGCAVRSDCLSYALQNGEYGVWGGTTEKERRRIAQDQYLAKLYGVACNS